jgi:excisionase family DNA binding protein
MTGLTGSQGLNRSCQHHDLPPYGCCIDRDSTGHTGSTGLNRAAEVVVPRRAGGKRDDEYMTSGEAARFLGVSARTVNRWADKGQIPYIVTLGGTGGLPAPLSRRSVCQGNETRERTISWRPILLKRSACWG